MNLVVLGSITEDVIITSKSGESHFIGGVPVYAASAAKALGETIGIVSKVGTDFPLKNLKIINSLDADLNGFSINGQSSMRFENKYSKGKRTQKVLSESDKITFNDIPSIYHTAKCIHLGPVFNEINSDLITKVSQIFDIVSLDGQGFTRSIDKKKKVILKPWLDYEEFLPQLDILKVDDAELMGLTGTKKLDDAIDLALNTEIPLLVITLADKGAIIFDKKIRYDIPALPAKIVDETGAGDTFHTAFLLEYIRTSDSQYSAYIAAATASYKIETSGPFPNYTRDDIIERASKNIPDFQLK